MTAKADPLEQVRASLLVIAAAGTPVVFWTGSLDVFALPKLTLVAACAVGLVATTAVVWVRQGAVEVRTRWFWAATAAFLLVFLLSAALSDQPWRSFVGQHGRFNGFLSYLAYAIVGLAAASLASRQGPRRVVWALAAALGLVTFYGLSQVVGIDLIDWERGRDASTLSNRDFLAAYVGMAAPLAALVASDRSLAAVWRAVAAGLGLGAGFLAVTEATQGVLTLAASMAVFGLVAAWDRFDGLRAWLGERRGAAIAAVGVVAVGGAATIMALWDTIVDRLGAAAVSRQMMWETALDMWRDAPIIGVGPGRFDALWTTYERPAYDLWISDDVPSAAHNVVLDHLSGGGVLLAVAYLAVVAVVLAMGLRGAARLQGRDRITLGALLGVWAGYQVQSLVSIEEPSIAVTHWVVAGLIAGLAARGEDAWRFSIPGVTETVRRKGKKARTTVRPTRLGDASVVGIMVIALVVAWIATRPLRADLAVVRGQRLAAEVIARGGDLDEVQEAFDRAHDLAPYEPVHWLKQAEVLYAAEEYELAYEAQAMAANLGPGHVLYFVNSAQMAAQLGDDEGALIWWQRVLETEPNNVKTMLRVADYYASVGDLEGAAQLADRAAELAAQAYIDTSGELGYPTPMLQAVRLLRDVVGDARRAGSIIDRALTIAPDWKEARELAGG